MARLVFGSKEANGQLERDTGFRFDLHYADPFAYHPTDEREVEQESEPTCGVCGGYMEWVECWNCGGKGGRDGDDLMEEDPMWYSEDDFEICDICRGKGGFWLCENRECPGESGSKSG